LCVGLRNDIDGVVVVCVYVKVSFYMYHGKVCWLVVVIGSYGGVAVDMEVSVYSDGLYCGSVVQLMLEFKVLLLDLGRGHRQGGHGIRCRMILDVNEGAEFV